MRMGQESIRESNSQVHMMRWLNICSGLNMKSPPQACVLDRLFPTGGSWPYWWISSFDKSMMICWDMGIASAPAQSPGSNCRQETGAQINVSNDFSPCLSQWQTFWVTHEIDNRDGDVAAMWLGDFGNGLWEGSGKVCRCGLKTCWKQTLMAGSCGSPGEQSVAMTTRSQICAPEISDSLGTF